MSSPRVEQVAAQLARTAGQSLELSPAFGRPVVPGRQERRTAHSAVYTAAWQQVRKIGLSPKQQASPLAADPYSLRHAAVSTWLAAWLSPVEVAERAGHSVAVLLKVCAAVLDGQHETSNQKIGDLLGDDD